MHSGTAHRGRLLYIALGFLGLDLSPAAQPSGLRALHAWLDIDDSQREYQSGRFLLDRLGAERYLDPPLMATLLGLRHTLLAELPNASAAEHMLVDMAVLGYYNTLRVQGWIGPQSSRSAPKETCSTRAKYVI